MPIHAAAVTAALAIPTLPWVFFFVEVASVVRGGGTTTDNACIPASTTGGVPLSTGSAATRSPASGGREEAFVMGEVPLMGMAGEGGESRLNPKAASPSSRSPATPNRA